VPAADFLLEHMSRTLWDPVDTTRVASLDVRLRARVNGEIYRFANATNRDRFRRDPVRWCGILRDPVTGIQFIPTRRAPRFDTPSSPYYFRSDSTRDAFTADTARYAIHRNY
jgi:YHS domain-containing protein